MDDNGSLGSTEQTPEEKDERTALWMPPGSVRAILAISITGFTCYSVAFSGFVLPDWWNNIFTGVVIAYFGKDVVSSLAMKISGKK